MQGNNDVIFPQGLVEVSLGGAQFYIIEQSNTVDDELFYTSEPKGVSPIAVTGQGRQATWDNWIFKAVQINGETLIVHSNGDAQHKGYLHNASKIHNKRIRIWIQAKRISTGANVFTLGSFSTDLPTNMGTPFDVNQFEKSVKDNWGDIESGDMVFQPNIYVRDYR